MSDNQQVDLFLESMVNAPVKDDRDLMEFPFFSLQKRPRFEPLIYDDKKGVRIEVLPGAKGIATIWDKDVLIYLVSRVNDQLERGLPVDRKIRFNVYDFLRTTGRHVGKSDYSAFLDAIERLQSTQILNTIETGGERQRVGFSWINDFRVVEKDRDGVRRAVACEITLNDWMFRAVVKDRRVLTLNREYFSLTMGLKRRLYELSRKHCGRQKRWDISLTKLVDRCGSMMEPRFFKRELRKVVEDNDLPDYEIGMTSTAPKRVQKNANLAVPRSWEDNSRIIVSFWPRSMQPAINYTELA